jgi:hypothetical protein
MNISSSSADLTNSPNFDLFKKDGILSSTASNVRNLYNSSFANYSLYVGLAIVIIITVIFAVVLYSYIGSQLFSKIKSEVSETRVPIIGSKLTKFVADIAKNANGTRRSYSFWIYINDMTKYKNRYQNVLALCSNAKEPIGEQSSPHVFLDKKNNTMYIRFAAIKTTDNNVSYSNNDYLLHKYMRQGIEIKYIPLQRWVHIVVVSNTDTFKNSLYAYVDGDLVTTRINNEYFKLSRFENTNTYNDTGSDTAGSSICIPTTGGARSGCKEGKMDISDIDLNVSGYLYIGASDVIANNNYSTGFSGVVSSFCSYNYELNQQDIYNIYKSGPISGFLAKLGLGLYGLRNPVYKL